MKLLLINKSHPTVPHVSAVRAWQFSRELASLGHQVVLITKRPEHDLQPNKQLLGHDWARPLVLAADVMPASALHSTPPRMMRKLATAFNIAFGLGNDSGWIRSSEALAASLYPHFRADLVWATFGTIESLHIARRIARTFRIPWVADIKDNYTLYVPKGLRKWVAHRFRSVAAVTCNSYLEQRQAGLWLGRQAELIYSGVDESFFTPTDEASWNGERVIHLVGGLYSDEGLTAFLRGVTDWVNSLGGQETKNSLVLRYSGSDSERFMNAAARAFLPIRYHASGYLPIESWATECRKAFVNAYLWHPDTFHHKLLELMAALRPVIAFPGESKESTALARAVGGRLFLCPDEVALVRALSLVFLEFEANNALADPTMLESFRWKNQTRTLEQMLNTTIARFGT